MADADAENGAAVLYEPLYGISYDAGFVLGGGAALSAPLAGAAGDWERRRDAPTAMRIAIGGDGEQQAPPAEGDTVRASRGCCAPRCEPRPSDGRGG
jgi:hypothetical protein